MIQKVGVPKQSIDGYKLLIEFATKLSLQPKKITTNAFVDAADFDINCNINDVSIDENCILIVMLKVALQMMVTFGWIKTTRK